MSKVRFPFLLWTIILSLNPYGIVLSIASDAVPTSEIIQPTEFATTHILARTKGNIASPRSRGYAKLNDRWKVNRFKPVFKNGFANSTKAEQLGLDRIIRIEVPEGTDTATMVQEYASLGDFEWVAVDNVGTVAEFIPNDPQFDFQWSLLNQSPPPNTGFDIDATAAWMIHACDGDVTIAIVDS